MLFNLLSKYFERSLMQKAAFSNCALALQHPLAGHRITFKRQTSYSLRYLYEPNVRSLRNASQGQAGRFSSRQAGKTASTVAVHKFSL